MTGNANIGALWASLEAWGRDNAPNMLEDLNPGANDEELGELQTALGRELPEPFLQSLKVSTPARWARNNATPNGVG